MDARKIIERAKLGDDGPFVFINEQLLKFVEQVVRMAYDNDPLITEIFNKDDTSTK